MIAALLLSAGVARWLDRPRPVLDDVPQMDLVALQAASQGQDPRRAAAKPAAKPEKSVVRPTEKIDPNRATIAQLQALPGVGPTLAGRIRAAADSAPFRHQSDLRRVPGIGPAMALKLAPLLALPPAPPQPRAAPGSGGTRSHATSQPKGPVNLNTATAAELMAIRGVGTVLAARLLARRDSLGRFTDWAQVDAVPGVGSALLARLREDTVLRE